MPVLAGRQAPDWAARREGKQAEDVMEHMYVCMGGPYGFPGIQQSVCQDILQLLPQEHYLGVISLNLLCSVTASSCRSGKGNTLFLFCFADRNVKRRSRPGIL